MVDMEEFGDRNSVKHVGTITCGEKEALELAQAESHGCTNHRANDVGCNREQHVPRPVRYNL